VGQQTSPQADAAVFALRICNGEDFCLVGHGRKMDRIAQMTVAGRKECVEDTARFRCQLQQNTLTNSSAGLPVPGKHRDCTVFCKSCTNLRTFELEAKVDQKNR